MRKKLVDLIVKETSGVDLPAHLHNGWVVMKSPNTTSATEILTDLKEQTSKRLFTSQQRKIMASSGAAMPDGSFPVANKQDLKNAIQAIGRASNPEMTKKHIMSRAKAMGMIDLVPDSWKGKETMTKDASDETNEETSEEVTKEVELFDGDVEMAKGLPEEVRSELVKAQNLAASAMQELQKEREELRKEREARQDMEFIQKAKDSFGSLSLNAEEVGPMLRKLASFDVKLYEEVEKALFAANGVANESSLLKEVGSEASNNSLDGFDKIDMLAKALITDGKAKTYAEAVSKAVAANPSLYTDYQENK